ncbi:MAG: DUF3015 family protein [Bdellovibrio sp.]
MSRFKSVVPALLLVCALPVMAQQKKAVVDQFSGAGYGLAGCGLGSILFGPKPGMVQVPSATTNGTYGNQTFGISSGTSNCDIPRMGQTAAVYLESNKEVVMKDASRGEGETLANLALLYNCKDTALFSQKVQSNYRTIFGTTDSYEQSRQMLNTIKSDSELSQACKI